jgi:hypothetical protein
MALGQILNYVEDHDVRHIYFGGDWFHTPGNIPTQAAVATAKWLGDLKERRPQTEMKLLVGNHDMANRKGDIHAQVFHDTNTVVKPGETIHWIDDGLEVFGLGYTNDPDVIKQFLEYAHNQGGGMLLMHQGVRGVPLSSGWVLDEALTPEMIPDNCRAFTGHYHYHQAVTPNLTVIGNLTAQNWNDIDQDKGFVVWDDDTNELEFIEIVAPKFITYDHQEDHISKVAGNFVRYSRPIDPSDIDATRTHLKDHGAATVEFPTSKIENNDVKSNFTNDVFDVDKYLIKLEEDMEPRRAEVGKDLREGTYEAS